MSFIRTTREYVNNQSRFANLNAFVSLPDRPRLLRHAKSIDENPPRLRDGTRHSLAGKLIGIKDNICTKDLPTAASSNILRTFTSPYDATVVKRLRDAGALIAGKTNMDEFGMGSHSTHSAFGPVKFSRYEDEQLSAGGSSGGSAAAVASAQCWTALGTDTGGSVRLPAAYTGVVGFKPSYGLLSRWGVIAYANSLDTVGILAGEVEAAEKVFNTLNVYDPQDPTSLSPSTRSTLGSVKRKSDSLTIGIPLEYNISSLHPVVRKAWMKSLLQLQECGHRMRAVHLPTTQHALSAYYVLAPAEASSNLAKYDGVRYGNRAEGLDGTPSSVLFAKTRGEFLGPEVRRRILLGAFSLSADAIDNYFIQAQKVRRLVVQDFDEVFEAPNQLVASAFDTNPEGVDALLCPTAPTLPPSLSEVKNQGPLQAYMNDVFTVPASLAGLPAISVPVPIAEEDRKPELREREIKEYAGMQIIGQFGHDDVVLDIARQLEHASREGYVYDESAPFHTAWGARVMGPVTEEPHLEPKRRSTYLKGSKKSYRNLHPEEEPVKSMEGTVNVPPYGRMDRYPSNAEKRARKRMGMKAKELGISLQEYQEKYDEDGMERGPKASDEGEKSTGDGDVPSDVKEGERKGGFLDKLKVW